VSARCCRYIPVILFTAVPVFAQTSPLGFENLIDSTLLTNQYSGLIFTNTIVLSSGITLDEFEFPAHGGSNVASDNGGPITISFSSPLHSFTGYFTHSVPLTVQAMGSSNNLLASSTSEFSGSQANELIQVSAATGIFKIVITGSQQGTSFTLDDATLITPCDLNADGLTNAVDVQAAINEALGTAGPNNDLNADGVVNAVDVQLVLNAALAEGCMAK
jgi:hypothetical protein